MPRKSTSTSDHTAADTSVTEALDRVASQFAQKHGDLTAYTCTIALPKQFSQDAAEANDLFKKIQSDFCKSVLRGTGITPRYVAIRAENHKRPEYRCALFTPADAPLQKPEEYADHGRAIANHKATRAGWQTEQMDIVAILVDSCQFEIGQPIKMSGSNRHSALNSLEHYLGNKLEPLKGNRSLFVSKTEKPS